MLPIKERNRLLLAPESPVRQTSFEVIDAAELARRWHIPKTWIQGQTRSRAAEPIPCVRLGKYVRFEWESPELLRWWEMRRK
jgi:hypothetical protein